MPPPEFASVTRPAAEDEAAARALRRRLRWGAILFVEIAVLVAVIYAALP